MAGAELIPLRAHAALDIGLGVLLIVLPLILRYTEETGAMVFHIVMGLLFIGSGAMTDWDDAEATHGSPAACGRLEDPHPAFRRPQDPAPLPPRGGGAVVSGLYPVPSAGRRAA